MCVICKQSRKTGKGWAGMTGPQAVEAAPAVWLPPLTSKGTARKEPERPLRYGKAAYVTATPFVAGGPRACDVRLLLVQQAVLVPRGTPCKSASQHAAVTSRCRKHHATQLLATLVHA